MKIVVVGGGSAPGCGTSSAAWRHGPSDAARLSFHQGVNAITGQVVGRA